MSPSVLIPLVRDQLWPAYEKERRRLDRIDRWYGWDHDDPAVPRLSGSEYRELAGRSQTPWLRLVVSTAAQAMYVEGYRGSNTEDNAGPWAHWQSNGMDGRQNAIHRAALAYGLAYVTVTPGADDFGLEMPVIEGHSPRKLMSFYTNPARDDWPKYALRVDSGSGGGLDVFVYDDSSVYQLQTDQFGSDFIYIEYQDHSVGVCPVVRYTKELDLEGRATGDVEPFIPVAARIDQTIFNRLVVQHFASWVVRTIAGMDKPDDEAAALADKLRLRVEDILIAESPDTKFGTLPASPLDGFIAATESDLKTLAAVTQTPAYELLGQLANLSAEALVAARASLENKVAEAQHSLGQSHEQTLRLAAWVMGDRTAAHDRTAQVRWADVSSRSLAQAADALGKLATMLQVPVEMLWEEIPGWTQLDVDRAKALLASKPPPPPPPPASAPAPVPTLNGQ